MTTAITTAKSTSLTLGETSANAMTTDLLPSTTASISTKLPSTTVSAPSTERVISSSNSDSSVRPSTSVPNQTSTGTSPTMSFEPASTATVMITVAPTAAASAGLPSTMPAQQNGYTQAQSTPNNLATSPTPAMSPQTVSSLDANISECHITQKVKNEFSSSLTQLARCPLSP